MPRKIDSQRTISDKALIQLLRGINESKDRQAVIGGDIRERIVYAVENQNYHVQAGAYVAKLIRMNRKDELARINFERHCAMYRDIAITAGLLEEHSGDLVENIDIQEDNQSEQNAESDENARRIERGIKPIQEDVEAHPPKRGRGRPRLVRDASKDEPWAN